MDSIKKDFQISGFTTIFRNDTGEYIRYELIMNGEICLPTTCGLYKFHFKEGYDRPYIQYVNCFEFVQDYTNAAMYGFKRYHTLQQELFFEKTIKNAFIRNSLQTHPIKYQFMYIK
jgi:hypothetical protein